MSKGNSNETQRKAASSDRAEFVGYVNVTLTENDKADFEVWEADTDLVNDGYYQALGLGYQFTLKQDLSNEVYLCSVSQFRPGKSDSGFIYTARSDAPNKALLKAIYVCSRKFPYDLSQGYIKRQPRDAF